jgi:hypothetical protein
MAGTPPGFAAAPAAFPAEAASERVLFPQPLDAAAAAINPPGFAWWRAPGAASYRLEIRDRAGRRVYEAAGLPDPVHLPAAVLPPGEYAWDVEACDAEGKALARRGAWRFHLPAGLPEFPWIDAPTLLARVPGSHPRYMFLRDRLPEIRKTLHTTRRRAWEAVLAAAERHLATPLPKPPDYHTFPDKVRQRMGYTTYFRYLRGIVDSAMSTMALAYLLSGDERYGLAAKKILMEVESWGIEGPMSVLAPWGDEPGLSMAKHGHRVYDWLYDLFDESERARVRAITIGRARQVHERLKRADYLANPSESHNGRMIAYLSEYAVVLKDEAPDAADWLDYSLRALTTFYPHWGDSDGGWAEGVAYALAYNTIYLGALESLRAAADYDLYQRPFFRSVRRFFLYCTSPAAEMKPFGDGFSGPVGGGGSGLMSHFGRRLQDPACLWYAEQAGTSTGDPLLSLLTEDTLKPAPPSDLPSAAVFRGIGWAGLHSALDQPGEDAFVLFKSSPFGSVSHSHADQNSFCVFKGGHALAIPSGYYGPSYGMPHHDRWTRQTKAHNSVLVDGHGQVVRTRKAAGRIADFRCQKRLTYVCGDAGPAYGGRLAGFRRHVVFLRPAILVTLDELEAPQPAEYRWLLHAFERMALNEERGEVVSSRGGATLTVNLACQAGLAFGQTDKFDTPYNEGNPPEYHEERADQWHFAARTKERAARTRIAAAMVIRGPGEAFETGWLSRPGQTGVRFASPEGKGEVWLHLAPNAARLVEATWQPAKGEPERLTI